MTATPITEDECKAYAESLKEGLPPTLTISFEESAAVGFSLFRIDFCDCPYKDDNLGMVRLLDLKKGKRETIRRIYETLQIALFLDAMNSEALGLNEI